LHRPIDLAAADATGYAKANGSAPAAHHSLKAVRLNSLGIGAFRHEIMGAEQPNPDPGQQGCVRRHATPILRERHQQGCFGMKIKKGFKEMLAEANAEIETLSVEDAIKLHGKSDVVFVDLRDPREMEREGKMPGAFPCTRGMLEFWIDPESPYHKAIFAEPKQFVFFCAGGWRSALAAKTAQDMGLEKVAHVEGGFGAWKKASGPLDPAKPKA
jgi:rhodanese-related sulfurtransferase